MTGLPEPSEAMLQEMIVDAAKFGGWMHFHDFDSRRNTPGFPDLILVRGGECWAVELKTKKGRVSAEQRAWIGALGQVEGINAVFVRGFDETEAFCRRLMAREGR